MCTKAAGTGLAPSLFITVPIAQSNSLNLFYNTYKVLKTEIDRVETVFPEKLNF